ncbi:hypothetical protein DFH06DRAFT_1146618 [Mycena polygramma]|nr:hypothetical protein DFH06DRAFT_1146618 [Mycena polygramma]
MFESRMKTEHLKIVKTQPGCALSLMHLPIDEKEARQEGGNRRRKKSRNSLHGEHLRLRSPATGADVQYGDSSMLVVGGNQREGARRAEVGNGSSGIKRRAKHDAKVRRIVPAHSPADSTIRPEIGRATGGGRSGGGQDYETARELRPEDAAMQGKQEAGLSTEGGSRAHGDKVARDSVKHISTIQHPAHSNGIQLEKSTDMPKQSREPTSGIRKQQEGARVVSVYKARKETERSTRALQQGAASPEEKWKRRNGAAVGGGRKQRPLMDNNDKSNQSPASRHVPTLRKLWRRPSPRLCPTNIQNVLHGSGGRGPVGVRDSGGDDTATRHCQAADDEHADAPDELRKEPHYGLESSGGRLFKLLPVTIRTDQIELY